MDTAESRNTIGQKVELDEDTLTDVCWTFLELRNEARLASRTDTLSTSVSSA